MSIVGVSPKSGGNSLDSPRVTECASGFDKLLERGDPFTAHASGDIGRGAVVTEEFEAVGFLVGQRRIGFRNIEDEVFGGTRLGGDEDEIVVFGEVALVDALFKDEVVGHLVLVEGIADPANILRAAPCAEDGETREHGLVSGNLRDAASATTSRPSCFARGLRVDAALAGTRNVPAAKVVLPAVKDFSAIWTATSFSP